MELKLEKEDIEKLLKKLQMIPNNAKIVKVKRSSGTSEAIKIMYE